MSYKALNALREHFEVEFIRRSTPEELNKMFNQLAHNLKAAESRIAELEEELEKREPDGWQLVPKEPTAEMLEAHMAPNGYTVDGYPNPANTLDRYRAMLSAASEEITMTTYAVADKVPEDVLREIASIVHHGALLGSKTETDALNTIRKLTTPYWDQEECDRLQAEQGNWRRVEK